MYMNIKNLRTQQLRNPNNLNNEGDMMKVMKWIGTIAAMLIVASGLFLYLLEHPAQLIHIYNRYL